MSENWACCSAKKLFGTPSAAYHLSQTRGVRVPARKANLPDDVAGASQHQEQRSSNMADRAPNLQDTFLNYVRKNKTPVTIFLINGVKLQGVVTWFDNFCVLLRRDGHSQLVYKHAISTVMPGGPVQLFEPAEEA
jgi:host factor-I protein